MSHCSQDPGPRTQDPGAGGRIPVIQPGNSGLRLRRRSPGGVLAPQPRGYVPCGLVYTYTACRLRLLRVPFLSLTCVSTPRGFVRLST